MSVDGITKAFLMVLVSLSGQSDVEVLYKCLAVMAQPMIETKSFVFAEIKCHYAEILIAMPLYHTKLKMDDLYINEYRKGHVPRRLYFPALQ